MPKQLLVVGGIPLLTKLAIEDSNEQVRRKAIYALSSEVRNYQPALNAALKVLHGALNSEGVVDAGDMDAVDQIIEQLKTKSAATIA